MAPKNTQADMVRGYIELLQQERKNLEESLERISDYAERLRLAADDAQQRLIGRSS